VRGNYFSANLGHLKQWHSNIQRYVEYITGDDTSPGHSYSLRYTDAFVADLLRILVSGGIFFYPGDPDHPMGKLRLLYKCAPLALLIENAGGRASDGARRILDIEAQEIGEYAGLDSCPAPAILARTGRYSGITLRARNRDRRF
jgi:fructose-1,6-bisphosphatase I